ncbi:hypothetical protein ACLOJK_025389 [Asimina triloba]
MSAHDQAAAAALAQLALAYDGAILGVTFAIVAVQTWLKYRRCSLALNRIHRAPAVHISDLRSLLASPEASDDSAAEANGKLVVVRGHVNTKSAVDGNWMSLKDNALISNESAEGAVIIQRTQTVPFVLIEGGFWPRAGYVVVNLDKSTQPLPLTTVYHQLHPVEASPYTIFQAIFGHGYPVGLLDEEKILPLGKEITAAGICRLKDGVPEIKSCKELPYFLSNMTKDQMEADLGMNTNILFWGGVLLGTLSFGILGYSIVRSWSKWKEWRRQRRQSDRPPTDATAEVDPEDESRDVPDGELCVICLMSRRRSAFVPCGHLVCCPRCAMSVERDTNPKCPVCRQSVRTSMRIYAG